ncbi:TetR/AcrR family transcriptional regulator [Streptomyces sp. NPDC086010]|uniref:TetR/AcrR family transcriptional regulator n=1 Tax=Streptomyces sp. NPDC086010 TaxID=3365745 RepID=UPI0037D721CC
MNSGTGASPLRRDARRNVERITAAAVEAFAERGLDCPLEEIARRAGVSPGTVYNRFGGREALIDTVVPELAAVKLAGAVESARRGRDSWERFRRYVEAVSELMASDPALSDVVTRRHDDSPRLRAVCAESIGHAHALLQDAQRAGSLRADFRPEDLSLVFGSVAALTRSSPPTWRRLLVFLLDGLRARTADP